MSKYENGVCARGLIFERKESEMEDGVRGWMEGDESAKEMLVRLKLTHSPLFLLPHTHTLPLRVGNVLEIVGPSSSAKTDLLIQAAITCILPNNWNGVHYGGLHHLVMFIDLDCRFDIQRLAQSLKHRIIQTNGSRISRCEQYDVGSSNFNLEKDDADKAYYYDKELFAACMRRFLYVRCYDSFQFLATLKTMHYQVDKETKTHDAGVHMLLIDSVGAFYWSDRTSGSLPLGGRNRKSLSLQSVSEAVVEEIQKLMITHPMLVIASKAAPLVDKYCSANESSRDSKNWSLQNHPGLRNAPQKLSYREFMPSVWQSFVTHRLLVRASDNGKHQNEQVFVSEWLLPSMNISERFVVRDGGIFNLS